MTPFREWIKAKGRPIVELGVRFREWIEAKGRLIVELGVRFKEWIEAKGRPIVELGQQIKTGMVNVCVEFGKLFVDRPRIPTGR